MRLRDRSRIGLFLILVLLGPGGARASQLMLVQSAAVWLTGEVAGWAIGEGIDWATGRSFERQLEEAIPGLVEEIRRATGEERAALEEELRLAKEQLGLLEKARRADREDIEQLRLDQSAILSSIEGLEEWLASLSREVDDLGQRVGQLEEALIHECLDLRTAPQVGGFRVREKSGSTLSDAFEGEEIKLSARLFLDSCTDDLTMRGLLLQLAVVTYDIEEEVALYVSFKDLRLGGFDPTYMNTQVRWEYPVHRAEYPVDGSVREIFIPYAEIPFPANGERLAMALVFTRDGAPFHSLADKVLTCVFGQRIRCRWGR